MNERNDFKQIWNKFDFWQMTTFDFDHKCTLITKWIYMNEAYMKEFETVVCYQIYQYKNS